MISGYYLELIDYINDHHVLHVDLFIIDIFYPSSEPISPHLLRCGPG
jgi:hypothetical protein